MATLSEADHASPRESRETHSFTLILSGFDKITDEIETRLYEAGCGDALLSVVDGVGSLDFDREAASLPAAIKSAIENVEGANLGIKVVRVVPRGERIIGMFNALLNLRHSDQASKLLSQAIDELINQSRTSAK